MSHRDVVGAVPAGFEMLACTETWPSRPWPHRRAALFAVQFHPEVAHTHADRRSCQTSSSTSAAANATGIPPGKSQAVEEQIRAVAGDRNVFFFVSGGVDSTVAYTLCLRRSDPSGCTASTSTQA